MIWKPENTLSGVNLNLESHHAITSTVFAKQLAKVQCTVIVIQSGLRGCLCKQYFFAPVYYFCASSLFKVTDSAVKSTRMHLRCNCIA